LAGKVYTVNIVRSEGHTELPERELIHGCVFKKLRISLTIGEKACMFFLHTNPLWLFVLGGMFLLPATLCPMWKGDGDFRGWIGGI